MTMSEVQAAIRAFRDERAWLQFHNPKDMATALAIEASELQEIFLWKNLKEIDEVVRERRGLIEEEMADIAIYLLELADILQIDLLEAATAKLRRNAAKYPVEKAKGSSAKYTEF
jgi:dCTP diphosphatase